MIPDIRGQPITDVRVVDGGWPEFAGRCGELEMFVRQPTPEDNGKIIAGAQRVSAWTRERYEMRNLPTLKEDDPKHIWDWPPFQPGQTGWFFVVMVVNDAVVGFGRHHYQQGDHQAMKWYDCPAGDMVAECSLCVVDDLQGKGLGSLYGQINKLVCKTMGAKWLVGTTYTKGAMMRIRHRDGFDVTWVSDDGTQCRVRGKL